MRETEFYYVPKAFFTDPTMKSMCGEAKILYAVLLDKWNNEPYSKYMDENGNDYIEFGVTDAQFDLHMTEKEVSRAFRQLEEVGLIMRTRRGGKQKSKIVVKDILGSDVDPDDDNRNDGGHNNPGPDDSGNGNQEPKHFIDDFDWDDFLERHEQEKESDSTETDFFSGTFGEARWGLQEEMLMEDESFGDDDTAGHEPINKYIHTYQSNSDLINTNGQLRKTINQNQTIVSTSPEEQIGYDTLVKTAQYCDYVGFIVKIMRDVYHGITGKNGTRIGNCVRTLEEIQKRFQELTAYHVMKVIECVKRTPNPIYNEYAYLMTALYNAPETYIGFCKDAGLDSSYVV